MDSAIECHKENDSACVRLGRCCLVVLWWKLI